MSTDLNKKNPKGLRLTGVYFDGLGTNRNITDFRIRNPKAKSILGLYVDGPIGMDHPLAKAKFQSEVDATLHYQNSISLREAIQLTLKRMRFLFGEGIPDELVRTAVTLTYAGHVESKTKTQRRS